MTLHAAIGRDEPSKCAQVWPLALCRGIARGCVDVLQDKHGLHALILQVEPFYFEVATGTLVCTSWDSFPVGTPVFTCPACVRCLVKTDVLHNRDPDSCRYPDIEGVIWTCPACAASKPLHHRGHTLRATECRAATTPFEVPTGRMRNTEPKVAASAEPSASMRQGAPEPDSLEAEISDFQAEQEREARAAQTAAQRREDKAASSRAEEPHPELAVLVLVPAQLRPTVLQFHRRLVLDQMDDARSPRSRRRRTPRPGTGNLLIWVRLLSCCIL